jgi:hypothetical protein
MGPCMHVPTRYPLELPSEMVDIDGDHVVVLPNPDGIDKYRPSPTPIANYSCFLCVCVYSPFQGCLLCRDGG